MKAGVVILVIGALLLIVNLTSTTAELAPGTFTVEEKAGTASPASLMLIIGGVVLVVVGYAKRMLAAAEKR